MIYSDVVATVGRTPLVELARLARGLPGRLLAKLEYRNPGGSIKDRLGVALIDDAEKRGVLRPGMTIIEPTGGNTGVGLAVVAAVARSDLRPSRRRSRFFLLSEFGFVKVRAQ